MKTKQEIGYGAKPPENECTSLTCPWHGSLKIRGRSFIGKVISSRAENTSVIEWDYYHYITKYERYERRRTRISVHNPKCIAAVIGDTVRIVECRPVSKTKSFVIVEKVEKGDKK